ncbi:condensin-2 complex subunit H2 [Iris pallida]|nr:condensin-2 complex subunit H2 [Iris pallida]KAJ6850045.1 condensin-2 complex subunit H2 [Iris pallida]
MDTEFDHRKFGDDGPNFDGTDPFAQDNLGSQTSLEDLCRSHLDTLLASIAESEKQTELAARVSTWKQRIEQTLEDEDSQPPFDIHQYGERILDRLSMDVDIGGSMSFTNVVMGQPKHDVARTFSALLQLVNNGTVDLQRADSGSELVCYSAANPFYVKLLHNERRKEMEVCSSSRKRLKSPKRNAHNSKANRSTSEATSPSKSLHQNGRLPVKIGKGTVIRCTPEGKRRRKSRMREAVDLQPAG